MLHRQHIFGQQLAGMVTDDGGPQYLVLAGRGEDLHEAGGGAVGNGAVEFVQLVGGHLDRDALSLGFIFRQADAGDLGIEEGCPRDDAIIRLEAPELAEQRVHGRIPGLVRGDVGELVWASHIPAGVDIGIEGGEIIVGHHGAVGLDAQFFQAIAGEAGLAANGDDQRVKGQGAFGAGVADDQGLLPFHPQRSMAGEHLHTRTDQ